MTRPRTQLAHSVLPGLILAGLFGCVPDSPLPTDSVTSQSDPRRQTLTLSVAGREWTYVFYTPLATADPGAAATNPKSEIQNPKSADSAARPVVLLLHGSGEDAAWPLDHNGWAAAADSGGFIVVAPNALPAQPDRPADFFTNPRLWNSGQPLPNAARAAIDDLAFFDALLDDVAARADIDSARIFVAGHSGGGSMAFKLAAERAERFAAIAVVAGQCWLDDPHPAVPVPTLYITGTADLLAPLAGGTQHVLWLDRTTPPVAETLAKWAVALGCAAEPTVLSASNGVQTLSYAPCRDSVPFTAIYIAGQGHVWPGGTPYLPEWITGPTTDKLNATEAIAAFFASHRLDD